MKVGEIYTVKKGKERVCGSWMLGVEEDKDPKYIKILDPNYDSSGKPKYEILNADKEKIDWCWNCFSESDLELVEEKPETKFKVGMRVRVKDDAQPHPGRVGVLEAHSQPGWFILEGYGYEPHELERIEEEQYLCGVCSNPSCDYDCMKINQTKERKSYMSQAVNFIKNQALKATNPEEYELRQAGLHNDCGELTSEGEALHQEFLRELTKEKMVSTAKELNAEKKEKK